MDKRGEIVELDDRIVIRAATIPGQNQRAFIAGERTLGQVATAFRRGPERRMDRAVPLAQVPARPAPRELLPISQDRQGIVPRTAGPAPSQRIGVTVIDKDVRPGVDGHECPIGSDLHRRSGAIGQIVDRGRRARSRIEDHQPSAVSGRQGWIPYSHNGCDGSLRRSRTAAREGLRLGADRCHPIVAGEDRLGWAASSAQGHPGGSRLAAALIPLPGSVAADAWVLLRSGCA